MDIQCDEEGGTELAAGAADGAAAGAADALELDAALAGGGEPADVAGAGAAAALAPSVAGFAAGLSLKSVAYQPVPLSAKPAAVSCFASLG